MSRYRTDLDRSAIHQRALAAAVEQGGVFSPADLGAWGEDPTIVRSMVRRGQWRRLRHGVYTDAERWDATASDPIERHLLECAGALRAVQEPALLFARSAAAALGLPLPTNRLELISLVRDRGSDPRVLLQRTRQPHRLPNVQVKTHNLTPYQPVRVHGLPCVPLELAAISAAATMTPEWALAVLDSCAWQRPAMLERLPDVLRDWRSLKGSGTVRQVLPLTRSGAQTPLESISRFRLMNLGVEEPELQTRLEDADGLIGFADMRWPRLGVIGEADGLGKYTDRRSLTAEKLREDRIRRLGYTVVRWTWRDIMASPEMVAGRIRQAAALQRRSAS